MHVNIHNTMCFECLLGCFITQLCGRSLAACTVGRDEVLYEDFNLFSLK